MTNILSASLVTAVLTAVLIVVLIVVAACAPATRSDRTLVQREAPPTTRDSADEFHVQMPIEGVRDVMRAKLAHAQAVMEGVVLEDFNQVRINAAALRSLSREAGWRVHTTVAYGVHSDDFRRVVSEMADHAAEENLDAVTLDYVQMTRSCLRCHAYMRSEGLYRDVPGEVSQDGATRAPMLSFNELMEAP